jgi:hypothetical protein
MGNHIFNGASAPGASAPANEGARSAANAGAPVQTQRQCSNFKQAGGVRKRLEDLALLASLALHAAAEVLARMGGAA